MSSITTTAFVKSFTKIFIRIKLTTNQRKQHRGRNQQTSDMGLRLTTCATDFVTEGKAMHTEDDSST